MATASAPSRAARKRLFDPADLRTAPPRSGRALVAGWQNCAYSCLSHGLYWHQLGTADPKNINSAKILARGYLAIARKDRLETLPA